MRNKFLLAILAIVVFAVALTGCNPKNKGDDGVKYGDIFVSHNGITEYSYAQRAVDFGEGVVPFTGTDNDYSRAFIEGYNLVVCQKTFTPEGATAPTTLYGVYNVDKGAFIGDGVVYAQFNHAYGLVTLVDENGFCLLYKYDGANVFGAEKGVKLSDLGTTSISDAVIPVSEDYFVIRHDKTYDVNQMFYYDVYKADGRAAIGDDGKQLSVKSKYYGTKNSGYVFGLSAVDDYLVSNNYLMSFSKLKTQDVIYYDITGGKQLYNAFKERGDFSSSTQERAAFYLGNGKLYCYQQETSTKEDGYTYSLDDKYYKILIWTYDLTTGVREMQSPDVIYKEIINKYNASETALSNYEYYVKDGYSLGNLVYLRNADKTVDNDQYIIDSDRNVYLSAYTHAGTATKYSSLNDDARDVLLTFVGGIGVDTSISAERAADLMVYNENGDTILRIAGSFYQPFYNNGIITAKQIFKDGDTTKTYYAAYKIDGTPLFDAESRMYSEMSAYVGDFALVKTSTGKVMFVDKAGTETRDISSEIYYNSSAKLYGYKAGVYVTKTSAGYGLKSFDGVVILESSFAYEVIDKRGTDTVLFYVRDNAGKWYLYLIK